MRRNSAVHAIDHAVAPAVGVSASKVLHGGRLSISATNVVRQTVSWVLDRKGLAVHLVCTPGNDHMSQGGHKADALCLQ